MPEAPLPSTDMARIAPSLGYKARTFTAARTDSEREEMVIAMRNEKVCERRLDKLTKQVTETTAQLARERTAINSHPKSKCKVASHMNLRCLPKPSEKQLGTFGLDQFGEDASQSQERPLQAEGPVSLVLAVECPS